MKLQITTTGACSIELDVDEFGLQRRILTADRRTVVTISVSGVCGAPVTLKPSDVLRTADGSASAQAIGYGDGDY